MAWTVQAFMGGLWGFCALNYATDFFEPRPSFTYAPSLDTVLAALLTLWTVTLCWMHHRECHGQHIQRTSHRPDDGLQGASRAHTLTGGVAPPQAGLCVSNGGGEAPTSVPEKGEAVQEPASTAGGAFPQQCSTRLACARRH
jgi:hypothetical protein